MIESGKIEVSLQSVYGSDRDVANAAWTSSTTGEGKIKKTFQDVERLIFKMATEGHSVPFESIIFRFWMRIPVMTDRQLMTHRMASMSGMSGRYRTMPNDWLKLPADVSSLIREDAYNSIMEASVSAYTSALASLKEARERSEITDAEYKRAREILRGFLPQAMMTERVMIINLRSLANFIRLRLSPHAQPEIREVARQMYQQIRAQDSIKTAIDAMESVDWELNAPNDEWSQYVD